MEFARAALFLLIAVCATCRSEAGVTSTYRRSLLPGDDIPLDDPILAPPPGYNAPEQVHITQGDFVGQGMIISWVYPNEPASAAVSYGTTPGNYTDMAMAEMTDYRFYNYSSGFIYHAVITGLEYNTRYYYSVGEADVAREFSFETPPNDPDAAYIFGVIGDLGQTYNSKATLDHYLNSTGQSLLYVGDLSYADHYPFDNNLRWDSWTRLVEPSTSQQAWIWTAGNHELDYIPEAGETTPFKPYMYRFHTPYNETNSTSPLWYAIQRGPATIIVLSSYSSYGKYTPQYVWLTDFLPTVNRTITPWLIVLLHSPWYNSNTYHYMEGETMRVILEPFIVQYQVDIIFAGHVHAYERTYPVSNIKYNIVNGLCTPMLNDSAPTYITIGDGGNIEGAAGIFTMPQPAYSAYREASFGHALFSISNRTTAFFTWHRIQDDELVTADSAVVYNKVYGPTATA